MSDRTEIAQTVLNTMLRSKAQPNSGELAYEIADQLMQNFRAFAPTQVTVRLVVDEYPKGD